MGEAIPDREIGQLGIRSRIKIYLKRLFSAKTKRVIKKNLDQLKGFTNRMTRKEVPMEETPIAYKFQPGDRVRIRPMSEIEKTLNTWGELKGCGFMDGMDKYCGTVQRVFKPVTRFVDERDYHVKKTRGVYLLQGLVCEGTKLYGRCDRSCFFFWREEWLEKVEPGEPE